MAIGIICQECQHTNPEGNRFCGMCGALLPAKASVIVREAVEVSAERRRGVLDEPGPVARRAAAEQFLTRAPRTAPPIEKSRPSPVSGPSFLGLNQPYDDDGKPYRDDDDLYGSNWGGRIAIVFIILIVVAALGYLQWRAMNPQQQTKPPQATAPEQAPSVNSPPSDPAAQQAGTPAATPGTQAAAGTHAPGQNANPAAGNNGGATPPSAAGSQPGATSPASNGQSANIGGVASTPSSNAASQIPESDKAQDTEQPANAAGSKSTSPQPTTRNTAPPQRDPEIFSQDSVNQAEVYLQGKGVPQNCDEGLGILRAAEARGNVPAIVKLGALYATGACVAMNRVSAYHFFTRAYRMEPHGDLLEHNRVMLWDEMSDGERQQASEQDGPLQ